MSWVINIILHVGIGDEDLLEKVNEYFGRKETLGFVSLDDEKLPKGWCGGTKFLEACLAIGAFNHLDLQEFLQHLKTINWAEPEAVQLILMDQEDYKFRIIGLFPDAQASYEQKHY